MSGDPLHSVSLADVEAVQPHESVGLTQRLCRPVSKHLTRWLLSYGVSAPAVSGANIVVGIIGATCLACPDMAVAMLFIPLAYFGEVLDCSDGEIARLRGTSDVTFFFADVAGHYFVTPLVVLARAARAPIAVHPLITSREGRLAGDFGFERPTHRLRVSLGTGMTMLVSAALVVELMSGFAATRWLSLATALLFPLWRAYDYAATIRSGRPANELRRILGQS